MSMFRDILFFITPPPLPDFLPRHWVTCTKSQYISLSIVDLFYKSFQIIYQCFGKKNISYGIWMFATFWVQICTDLNFFLNLYIIKKYQKTLIFNESNTCMLITFFHFLYQMHGYISSEFFFYIEMKFISNTIN